MFDVLSVAVTAIDDGPRSARTAQDPSLGVLLESFVVTELAEQLTWASCSARIYHACDRDGLEVDSIVEASDLRVLVIEVKASSVARRDDARPIATLRDRLDRVGDRLLVGIVFHTGDRRVSLGDRIVGLPVADLWT